MPGDVTTLPSASGGMAGPVGLLERFRRSRRAHPDLWDASTLAVLGTLLVVIGLTGIWSAFAPLGSDPSARWWHLAFLLPACAALLLKRRHPLVVLLVVTALFAGDVAIGSSLGMLLVFWDALYAAAYFSSAAARRWVLRILVVAILGATIATAIVSRDAQQTVFMSLQAFGILATPYWWATAVRQKSELAELAEQRADDLQRMAQLRESEILREERARMARDLHDVIAGQLSAIAIHSEAALAHESTAERDRATLHSIRGMSVRSLDEMRSMIVLLRGGHEPAATAGGLARLPELVKAARESGLSVEVDEAALATVPGLPSVVDQAAARILQEALTNAVKYAPRGSVSVRVGVEDGALLLSVASRATAQPSPVIAAAGPRTVPGRTPPLSSSTHPGLGLLTMTERATALGGSLAAGWADETQTLWAVTARLPLGRTR